MTMDKIDFQTLKAYLETRGLRKCLKELETLNGISYVNSYLKILEFVKSKKRPISDYEIVESMSFEQIEELSKRISNQLK